MSALSRVSGVLLAAVALVALAPWAPAEAATVAPQASAYQQVADCFSQRRNLAVLALVDESGSLQQTDPHNLRVSALIGMLDDLARHGTGGDLGGSIQIQLAGFGTDFVPGTWQNLNQTTSAGLDDTARQFATRNTAQDTDFALALTGAQQQFAQLDTATHGQPPCRLLVLFTDGVYDIETAGVDRPYAPGLRDPAAIMAAGRHGICDPGELADQLRDAGTSIFAIGLVAGQVENQSFLQSIAEQSAAGTQCGDVTSPPGDYAAVDDVDQLLAAFDSAIVKALGGTQLPDSGRTPACAPSDTTDFRCTRTFTLDRSLSEFHMLVDLGSPRIQVRVQPPQGDSVPLNPGNTTVAGATLATTALTGTELMVDGSLPAGNGDWVGTWTVRFVNTGQDPGAAANFQLTLFGALQAVAVPTPPGLRFDVGGRSDFRIRIVDVAGTPRTPAGFVHSAGVSAVVLDPRGESGDVTVGQPGPDGTYAASYTTPRDTTSSYVDLRITLNVTTSTGIELQPKVTTYQVALVQPAAYPSIRPLELRLATISDTSGTATGTVTVIGGTGSGQCVWFQAAFTQAPPDTGPTTTEFAPTSVDQASCVRVTPGQRATVRVDARPRQVRDGIEKGNLTAHLTVAGEPARTVTVPVRFEMQIPIDTGERWALFVGIVAAGVLLPLVLLWLVNWFLAKFVRPGQLRRATLPVVVTDTSVLDAVSGLPLGMVRDRISFAEMESSVAGERCVWFDAGPLRFRRRIPLWPWVLPYGRVTRPGAYVLTALGGRSARSGRVSLNLGQTWILVIDGPPQEEGRWHGELFLYVTDIGVPAKAGRLIETVETELPDRVRAVAGRLHFDDPHTPQPPNAPVYQAPI